MYAEKQVTAWTKDMWYSRLRDWLQEIGVASIALVQEPNGNYPTTTLSLSGYANKIQLMYCVLSGGYFYMFITQGSGPPYNSAVTVVNNNVPFADGWLYLQTGIDNICLWGKNASGTLFNFFMGGTLDDGTNALGCGDTYALNGGTANYTMIYPAISYKDLNGQYVLLPAGFRQNSDSRIIYPRFTTIYGISNLDGWANPRRLDRGLYYSNKFLKSA